MKIAITKNKKESTFKNFDSKYSKNQYLRRFYIK